MNIQFAIDLEELQVPELDDIHFEEYDDAMEM